MPNKYLNKLHGKRVLVIGGTSGIGFAVAEASVEYGAIVVVASSTQEKIKKTIARIQASYPEAGDRIRGHRVDLASDDVESQVKTLLEFATDGGQHKLDHVVDTAGDAIHLVTVKEADAGTFAQAGRVRIVGAVILAKYATEYINVSSTSSLTITGGVNTSKPNDNWSIAAGVGAAKEGLTRGLARDLRPIRVNLVSPGAVNTELFEGFAKKMNLSVDQVLASYREKTLTGTVGTPEDLAESYLYLMKNSFVTGTITHAEGGYLLV